MSYKFQSLIIILNKLDSTESVTVNSLMNDLEVSERTAHRYINTLQVAGFPIGYSRLKRSYAFDEGFSLRKPNLSVEEMLALALAKKVLGNFGSGIDKSITSIENKLLSKKADLPKHIILSAATPSSESDQYLGAIERAVKNFQTIEITYDAVHSNDVSQRKVNPYYLFYLFPETFWYLRGYCHLAKANRTFALDRISSLKVLDEHFLPKPVVPENEVYSSFGAWLDGEPTEVILVFGKEIKSQVLRKKWHQSQKEKELKDGRLQLTFNIKGVGAMKKWIYQWIPYVEVVAPNELKRDLKKELGMALKLNR